MAEPSTEWRETIAPDEASRFADYAEQFVDMQKRKSAKYGNGRALHRKQLLALRASFEVLPDLPEYARHGLFARPGSYDAWVRLSNGGTDRARDATPDIRGFAIKVRGVQGAGALGKPTEAQDFLLINQEKFAFPKSDEFVGLVMAASKGNGALFGYLLRRYGLLGALKFMVKFAATLGRKFSGFATERMHSATPIACGPYAVRVRLLPAREKPLADASNDWAADFGRQLASAPLVHELQLQFFVDEQRTPIEDASVDWSEEVSPYVTVARLSIPQQSLDDAAAAALTKEVEQAVFDPWDALVEHRPLGDVMRARKAVYFASQQARGAA
ncbi:MAG: catalase [Burkholderiales bacterium]|nr:catalase [Burkholderiales bacterium]